jgi:hypothetical protein
MQADAHSAERPLGGASLSSTPVRVSLEVGLCIGVAQGVARMARMLV